MGDTTVDDSSIAPSQPRCAIGDTVVDDSSGPHLGRGLVVEKCASWQGFLVAEHEGASVITSRFPFQDHLAVITAGLDDGHPGPVLSLIHI